GSSLVASELGGRCWGRLASSLPRVPGPLQELGPTWRGSQEPGRSTSSTSTLEGPDGSCWQLRSAADFEQRSGCKATAGKRYFQHTRLADIIAAYPLRAKL
ncbi:kinase-like protein, partial [Haematococcus lacustris]